MSGNRSKSAFVEGGWVTLSADFRGKGASSTNHCWCQKTRVTAVSCGIKIFAVRCLVLSQYTHLTDRRADGQTDGQTEFRQQYRALHYMQSHGKTMAYSNHIRTLITVDGSRKSSPDNVSSNVANKHDRQTSQMQSTA